MRYRTAASNMSPGLSLSKILELSFPSASCHHLVSRVHHFLLAVALRFVAALCQGHLTHSPRTRNMHGVHAPPTAH